MSVGMDHLLRSVYPGWLRRMTNAKFPALVMWNLAADGLSQSQTTLTVMMEMKRRRRMCAEMGGVLAPAPQVGNYMLCRWSAWDILLPFLLVANTGKCRGVTCYPLSTCHGVGMCDATTGKCSQPTLPAGVPCNDSDCKMIYNQCDGAANARAQVGASHKGTHHM